MLRNYNKRFYYKLCYYYYYYYYVYVNPRFQGGNPRFSDPRFHVGNPRLNQPQILRWQPQIVQPQIFHCQPQTQKIFRASRGSGVTQIIQYAPGLYSKTHALYSAYYTVASDLFTLAC